MNPWTGEPWTLGAKAREEIARLLRRDRVARQYHVLTQLVLIDREAADYFKLSRLRDEIADERGPAFDRLKRRAEEKPWGFAAAALENHSTSQRRGRGRPRLTRERFGLVFALSRVWQGRVRLSKTSSFVRVLGIVLREIDGTEKGAYGIARRAFAGPMPAVGRRLEPVLLRSLTA